MKNFNDFNDFNQEEFDEFWKKMMQVYNELSRELRNDPNSLFNNFHFITDQSDLDSPEMKEFFKNIKLPLSDMDIDGGKDENGEWERKSWTSPDGSVSYTSFSRSSGFGDLNGESIDDFMDLRRGKRQTFTDEQKLQKLKKDLNECVEKEEYEKAAEIKKQIDELAKTISEKK